MCDAIELMGNPFLNTAKVVLDSHDYMDGHGVEELQNGTTGLRSVLKVCQ